MKPQIPTIHRALRIIAALPEGVKWGLFVTDEDTGGDGDESLLSALNVTVYSTEALGEALEAISPGETLWPLSKFGDYYRRFDLLEVTVVLEVFNQPDKEPAVIEEYPSDDLPF